MQPVTRQYSTLPPSYSEKHLSSVKTTHTVKSRAVLFGAARFGFHISNISNISTSRFKQSSPVRVRTTSRSYRNDTGEHEKSGKICTPARNHDRYRQASHLFYIVFRNYTKVMISDYLFCDWDESPALMDFERPYLEAIERCAVLLEAIASYGPDGKTKPETWPLALELFGIVPAIINVALNYHICIGLGMPLHPTEYFEVSPEGVPGHTYPPEMTERAFLLYESAIELAISAYALDPAFPGRARRFSAALPSSLGAFIYTSRADKYTWRGSEPAKVRSLADSILRRGCPELVVGLAHGSIMSGLLLACMLGCRLWFLRFSMFKRKDIRPVLTPKDEELLRSFGQGEGILIFDEDSASGTTLSLMAETIGAIAPKARTGSVIRHASSSFRPDHVGRIWWD